MDTLSAFALGEANRGKPLKVFDWDRAAAIIRDRKPQVAGAGLSRDWEYTGGDIYRDGRPVFADESYTYLASTWATPELDIDGEIIDCWRPENTVPTEWGGTSDVRWPKSALDILNAFPAEASS